MVGKPQASVMWLSAPQPSPEAATEELDGDTRGVECNPCLSTGLLSKLSKLGCIQLQIFESGWAARVLLAAHHRIHHPKGEKNKISGWSKSLDVWNVRVCTHVSLISLFCTQTHLADRPVYCAEDEFGRSGCT